MPKHGRKSSDSQPDSPEDRRALTAGRTEPRFGLDTRLGSAPAVQRPSRLDGADGPTEPGAESGHTWSNLRPLEETRLRIIFPEVADEIVTRASTGDTAPVVRTASFSHTSNHVSVKIMLMPEWDDNGDIHHFTGIIHSLNPE